MKRAFRKIGRNSLASSHAGTRLPIAVVLSAGYRALPLCPPDAPSGQLPCFGIRQKVFILFYNQKGKPLLWKFPNAFTSFSSVPTLALSKSGYGSKAFLPLSLQDKLPFVFTCKFNYIPLFQKWQGFHSANLSKEKPPDGLIFSCPHGIIAVRKDYRSRKGGQSKKFELDRLTSVRRSFFIYPLF